MFKNYNRIFIFNEGFQTDGFERKLLNVKKLFKTLNPQSVILHFEENNGVGKMVKMCAKELQINSCSYLLNEKLPINYAKSVRIRAMFMAKPDLILMITEDTHPSNEILNFAKKNNITCFVMNF